MKFQSFTFNPFSENTYLIIGKSKSCFIVDPGMLDTSEDRILFDYIADNELKPIGLLLTHGHIDHVLGIKSVHKKYGLKPESHKNTLQLLEQTPRVSQMYGVPYFPGPSPEKFLDAKSSLTIDGEKIEIRFVPGHSPDHLVFIDHIGKKLVAGDTLFRSSIGRTDLPGGNHEQLLAAIRKELFSLEDSYEVWPGHGPSTTIGFEKKNNPFL